MLLHLTRHSSVKSRHSRHPWRSQQAPLRCGLYQTLPGRPPTGQAPRGATVWVVGLALTAVVVAGLVGLVLSSRRLAAQLLAAAFLLVVLSAAATISKPRFRFPCDPLLAVYGLVALRAAITRIQRRRRLQTHKSASAANPFECAAESVSCRCAKTGT